jgi:hypothetical protein
MFDQCMALSLKRAGKNLSCLVSTAFLPVMLFMAADSCYAATLEEQTKSLEQSVQTVDQRRRVALKDLNVSVLQKYRDALQIDSVDTRIGEVFDRTARVEVTVKYSFDFEKSKEARESLSKYFDTDTDKEPGVEPYGRIYTKFNQCVGAYCAVRQEMTKFLERSAVGIYVTFLGVPGVFVTTDSSGHFELASDSVTIQFDVPKSSIKGDPKPKVTAQVFDSHFCPDENVCARYTVRK